MAEIKFTDETALPTEKRDNEFRAVIAALAKAPGSLKSYVVSEATEADSMAKVAADKRKMAEAGNELSPPVSVRTPRVELLSDKKSVKVWVTTVPKIRRARKEK